MDPMIQQTIDGLLSGFAQIQIDDPQLQAEVDAYQKEMRTLGESSSDVGAFMTELQTSGLMQRASDLLTKAATASGNSASDAANNSGGDGQAMRSTSPPPPTVREFLEQYRPAYEAARNHGYQFRAVKAYEALFAVADRTDDLLEMHIMLEEEGHLRAMTAEALYDVNKLAFDSQDPNHAAAREQFRKMMQLAESYQTDPELDYRADLLIQESQQGNYRFNFRVNPVANLGHALVSYIVCKQRVWSCDDLKKDIPAFIVARENLARTYRAVQENFDWDFDTICGDPWLERWLILTVPVEALGLGCRSLSPANLEIFREILFDEALSDLDDSKILLRPCEHPMFFSIDSSTFPEHAEVEAKLPAAAEAKLKHRYYYDYQRKIKAIDPTHGSAS
ncbi:MAG: hypothetical protein RIF32_07100 [Leptospirales bacterium]|jgi:hypothetical protein